MIDVWNTPERVALRQAVTAFTTDRLVERLPAWEDAGQIPRSVHAELAEAGFLAVGYREDVGGAGGNLIDSAIVTEAIIEAGGSSGLIASLFTHGIATPHIMAAGSADLVDRYVRPTLAGHMIGSLAVTEPSGGSDVASLGTRAERDGDEYIVTGAKTFITSGVRADFYTCAVRTGGPGHGGVSLLVIDRDTPGFTVSGPLKKMGWHCSDTAELSFDSVRVPASNIVGAPGAGFGLIMAQFVTERLTIAVQAYATAQRALDVTVRHCQLRSTFGEPLINRQAVRHTLVTMKRRTEAAKALTRQAIERAVAADDLTSKNAILDAVLAKNQAVEAVEYAVHQGVQLHGGAGYMRESEIERHYRDARILGIGGGASEVLADLAAKLLDYREAR